MKFNTSLLTFKQVKYRGGMTIESDFGAPQFALKLRILEGGVY